MTRILVVEDSPSQAEAARQILTAGGFETEVARDGAAGLEAVRSGGFDLVVSDVMMPAASGYELCRAIKADPALAGTPVVLLTALGDPVDIVEALECGADGFITKPYRSEQLVARVASVLENRALRAGRRGDGPVEVVFQGRTFAIEADKAQILDLLVATFEDVVRANAELKSKQAEVVRIQRQKEELSQLVVHDLKNPLNGMFLLLRSLARSSRLGDDERESVELLRRSCDAMQRMVLNLLDIGRAEDGMLAPRPSPLDLRSLAEDVRREAAPQAAEREQRIETIAGAGEAGVSADRDMIRRVVENLVDNALNHAPSRSVVRIEVRPRDDAVELRVCDLGPGVPPEERERVFEKYVQLARSHQGARTSRGLGLAFCRMAVEAHGGRIWVEPNEPSGSSFCVRLPRR